MKRGVGGIMKKIIIIAVLGNCVSNWAKIIEMKDLNQGEDFIDSENPLIIFDMANTLIKLDKSKFDEMVPFIKKFPEFDTENLKLKWFIYNPSQGNVKNIIQDLQNKYKVIILTSCKNGEPFYKLYQANKIGLDFNQAFPDFPLIKLEGSNGESVFDNGIICCGKNSKGEVLQKFLEKIDYMPSSIIFVDNNLQKVKSVESYMQKMKIPITGLWYTRIHRT